MSVKLNIVEVLDSLVNSIEASEEVELQAGGEQVPSITKVKKPSIQRIIDRIYEVSQYLCPVDTSDLKTSGKKENVNGVSGVSYNMAYALFVHDLHGLRHDSPTQSNYLEDAGYIVLHEFGGSAFTFRMERDGSTGKVALWVNDINQEEFDKHVKDIQGELNMNIEDLD